MVKHILRTTPSHGVESFQKWTPAEVALNEQLIMCTENVHNALCGKILFLKLASIFLTASQSGLIFDYSILFLIFVKVD